MNKAKTCPLPRWNARIAVETWQFYNTEEDALCAWNTRTEIEAEEVE